MTTSAQSLKRRRSGFRVFADLSLRIKLILVFLAVTLLAVTIISLLNIRSTSAALFAQVGEGMSALAETEAHAIGRTLARRIGSMQAWNLDPETQIRIAAQNATYSGENEAILAELAKLDKQWTAASDDDPLIQEHLEKELSQELAMYIRTVPDFSEAVLTDRYGGLVASSDRTSDYYQADEDWWQTAFNNGQGAVYIGTPELDESTGTSGITMAIPLYAPNSSDVIGILRTTLNVTELAIEFGDKIGETGEVDLVLPGGNVFSGYIGHEQEHDRLDAATMARLEGTSHRYTEAAWNGIPSLIGFADVVAPAGEEFISDLGWKVVAYQTQEEALAAVTTQTRNTLLLALLVASITVVVAVALGQVLAGPIARLTAAVNRFTEGDLSARIDIDSRDETGVLAASFNQMAQQVGTLLTDIQARSAELEERTRELEASQSVTFAASERSSPDELLGLVVDLVRDQFDLYHAQMYMVNEEKQVAVLRESTGYAGSQLLQSGHQIPLAQTALVTKAIREKEPVLVDDTSQDPNFMPNPLLPETQTELVVPLRVGDRVLGALDIQDRIPGRFSESTVALFQAMTDQVAFLFENNELLERVSNQTEALTVFTTQLRTASDIAEHLSTILDPEQMLHEMAELMQSRFGLYHVHIYVLDDAKRKLVVQAGSGEVGQVLRERGHSIPLDAEKSLVARAARSGEPVLIEDTSLESDFMPNPLLPQTRSELSVPLVVGKEVLGVLDIQDDQAERFAESDVDTFSTLAGLAASSLQNASLFKQVETHAREAEMRYEISRALANAQSEEEVLDVLLEKAGIYPNSMAAFNLFLTEEEKLAFVIRKASAFESRLPAPPAGQIFKASDFPLINYLSAEEPFVCNNLDTDERIDRTAQEFFKSLEMGSTIAVPITAGGDWLGYIGIGSKQEDYFDEEKIRLYQTLAEQGAVALRTARLRDELQESLARFNGFSETTDYGFGIADLEGNITFINPALLRMLGEESTEAVKGKKLFEYYPPEKVEVLNNTVLPSLTEEEKWTGELELLSVDGRRIPTEESLFVIRDEHGNPRYIADIITDITVRKQVEEAIKESEERFRGLYEASPLGIILSDYESGDYLEANQAFVDMIGYSIEELNQLSYWDLTPKKYEPDEGEQIRSMEETGRYGPYQKEYIRKDGHHIPVVLNGVLVTDPKGRKLIWSTVADITYRLEAEEALRSLEMAVEQSIDGIAIPDLDGNIQFVNPAWAQMHGYSVQELQGKNLSIFHTEEQLQKEVVPFNEKVMETGANQGEVGHVRKDGTTFPTWMSTTVLTDEEGKPVGLVGTARDITEQKETEARMLQERNFSDSVINGLPGIFYLFDEEGNLVRWNRNFEEVTGYSAEELSQMPVTQFVPEPDQDLILRSMQKVFTEGQVTVESRILTKSGEEIPYYFTGLRTTVDDEMYLAGVGVDITERVQAERERERFTTQLSTAAEIATQASAILDPDELLNTVITLLKERFNLYYAHFYRLGEAAGELVLSAGYGKPGQAMLKKGHSIPLDREQSLVAQAARSKKSVVVHDVSQDLGFMPNPLLPDTKSEVAVPLISGDEVLGVFDVQHNEVNYFTQGDLDVFATLAGQVATALQNARLFEQTQANLQVNQALADAQTEDEVLDALIDAADFYPEASVVIQMIDPDEKDLNVIVSRSATFKSGLEVPVEGERFTTDQFPLLQLVTPDTNIVSSNIQDDERVNPAIQEMAQTLGIRSVAAVPITAGNEWMGVITVSSSQEKYFEPRKLYLYQALAEHGAITLQAARLRDKARESEAHYRGLIESQRDLVVRVDPQGRFTFVNDAYCEMFGKKREELIGNTFMPLVHPDDVESTAETMKDLESPPYRVYLEQRAMTVDGWRWLGWEDYAIRDEQGNVIEIQGVGRDITDRMQALESLRESEERFRGLYETSPLGIILNDYESGDYLEANQAFLDMTGYSIEELNQLSFWDLTPKKYEPDEAEQFQSMEKTGRYGPYQKEYIRKDGVHIPVVLNGVSVIDGNGRRLIWSTVADITYRIKKEEELSKSAK